MRVLACSIAWSSKSPLRCHVGEEQRAPLGEERSHGAHGDHGSSTTTTFYFNRIAFCVRMPNPTATASFFQVTRQVQVMGLLESP